MPSSNTIVISRPPVFAFSFCNSSNSLCLAIRPPGSSGFSSSIPIPLFPGIGGVIRNCIPLGSTPSMGLPCTYRYRFESRRNKPSARNGGVNLAQEVEPHPSASDFLASANLLSQVILAKGKVNIQPKVVLSVRQKCYLISFIHAFQTTGGGGVSDENDRRFERRRISP